MAGLSFSDDRSVFIIHEHPRRLRKASYGKEPQAKCIYGIEEIDKIVEAHKFSRSNVTSDLERDDGDECLREIIKYFPLLSTTTTSAALT